MKALRTALLRPRHLATIASSKRPRVSRGGSPPMPAAASTDPLAGEGPSANNKTIATHSGSFHCDEALGCWLLRRTAAFAGARIVRSRDPAVYGAADVVIDVGGVYDPATHRYDHHQKEFQDGFGHGFTTRLSSAGLVYKHFGREVVEKLLAEDDHPAGPPKPVASAAVEAVYLATYRSFMEAVDAIDNGVNRFPGAGPPAYASSTDLASRVGGLNPAWNEPDQSDEVYAAAFAKAVAITGEAFTDAVLYTSRHWLPARRYVEEAVAARFGVDSSGAVIELTHFCPWKSHVYEMEGEEGGPLAAPGSPAIKFCIFQDDREGTWRVQCLSECPGSFKNRLSLPAPLCGLRGDALDAAASAGIAGVTPPPGGVFIHVSGFTGGHKTREGALAYAQAALAAEAAAAGK